MSFRVCLNVGLAAFAFVTFVTFCKKTSVWLLVPTFIGIEPVQTTMTAFRTKICSAVIISALLREWRFSDFGGTARHAFSCWQA
jgi:hypothetical protein